jgi:hypothetical protein
MKLNKEHDLIDLYISHSQALPQFGSFDIKLNQIDCAIQKEGNRKQTPRDR